LLRMNKKHKAACSESNESPMPAWAIPSALELQAHTIQAIRITDAVQCYCDGVCVPVMCGSIADSSGTSRYCISWDNTETWACERVRACVQVSVVYERTRVLIRMDGNAWETSGRTRDVATRCTRSCKEKSSWRPRYAGCACNRQMVCVTHAILNETRVSRQIDR
jgi:hypothetical protein